MGIDAKYRTCFWWFKGDEPIFLLKLICQLANYGYFCIYKTT